MHAVPDIGTALVWRHEISFGAFSTSAVADILAAGARSTILFYASAAAMCISGESIAADGGLCHEEFGSKGRFLWLKAKR
jgi:hypothetical protein